MLLGRGHELAALAEALREDCALVAVTGEPGVGKTAVVRAAVEGSGREVFEGGAFATLSWLPFVPLVRAFGAEAGSGDVAYAAGYALERLGPDGVLFLDDLHWADRATLDVVGALRGRARLLVALRRGAEGADAALAAVDGATILELDGLEEADALELLRLQAPALAGARALRVVRAAGGNPLLLEELAAGDGVSDSLRLALEARLRALTPEGMRAMAMLSLAGRPLPLGALGAGSGQLLEKGLAVQTGESAAVRHALLAETTADMLDEAERRNVHAAIAAALTAAGEQARHLAAAGLDGEAYEAARLAADEAPTPGERAAHLEVAMRCAPEGGADALRLEAAEAMAQALMVRELSELLEGFEPAEPADRARVELHRSVVALDLGDPAGAESAVDRGLELVRGSGSSTEGLLLSRKGALEKLLHNRPEASLELARAGATLTDEADRPRALSTLAWMLSEAGSTVREDWVPVFLEAIEAARAVSSHSVELMARLNLSGCLLGSLSPQLARPHIADSVERARELRLRDWERMLRWLGASLDHKEGSFARAIGECDDLLLDPVSEHLRSLLLLQKAEAALATGAFADAAAALDTFGTLEQVRPYNAGRSRMVRADLELWSGRPAAAITLADELLAEGREEHAYLRIETRLVRAWARHDLGHACEDDGEEALTEEDEVRNAELRTIGLVATDPAAAAAAFADHAEAWRPASRRDELRCRWASGETARRGGDPAAALRLLRDCEEQAAELGMTPLLARVHRSLRLLGERRDAPRSTAGVLTGREREILELVSAGLTNPEIARRLGTSVPTVARQIATAAGKLGAGTRAQAAVLAARE